MICRHSSNAVAGQAPATPVPPRPSRHDCPATTVPLRLSRYDGPAAATPTPPPPSRLSRPLSRLAVPTRPSRHYVRTTTCVPPLSSRQSVSPLPSRQSVPPRPGPGAAVLAPRPRRSADPPADSGSLGAPGYSQRSIVLGKRPIGERRSEITASSGPQARPRGSSVTSRGFSRAGGGPRLWAEGAPPLTSRRAPFWRPPTRRPAGPGRGPSGPAASSPPRTRNAARRAPAAAARPWRQTRPGPPGSGAAPG